MSDLDDRLHKIWQEEIEDSLEWGEGVDAHYYGIERDDVLAQLKQAFEDAGYIQHKTGQITSVGNRITQVMINDQPFCSGQEWYDRYQAEIEKMNESTDFKAELARIKELYPGFKAHEAAVLYTASKLEEAAKRASGLEGDASLSTDQGQESP